MAQRTSFGARQTGWRHRPLRRAATALVVASTASLSLVVGVFTGSSSATAPRPSTHIGGSVSVWAEWTGSPEQTDFLAALGPFERTTGVTVNYESKGSNMDTALDAAVAGGKPPNVAFVPDPGTLRTLASEGKVQKLAPVLGSLTNNYGAAWNDLASYNGTLYGVWYKAANKNTIWYNPALFAEAGITKTPTTWQQLLADAATLQAAGITPFSLCTDIGWPVADLWQNLYLKINGATDYNELAAHTIPWTSSTVTNTFDALAELVGHPSYLLGGTQGALAAKYPDCVNPVFPAAGSTPTAAMVIEADFVVSQIEANSSNYAPGTTGKGGAKCTANPSETPCYDFFAFPAPAADSANQSAIQGSGDVGMLMTNTPQARALIRYIASETPGKIWAKLGGFTSPNKSVPLSVYPDPVTRADASELINATSFVFSLDDLQGTWEPELWQDMLDFVRTPTSSEIKSLESTMQKQANASFAKAKK
jgi:multiple sugar transport system substrate-binding protein/alpha-glucoside transport system substrate-binding protein